VRAFIEAFNENMVEAITPGFILVIDEIMSAWKGQSSDFMADGIPHKTLIVRKPEGSGAEIKALGCGETGVLLRLDLMEQKDAMRQKPHVAEWGAGTAVCLRMCAPWAGIPRVLVADSAFSSVKTLRAMWTLMGIYFLGAVKTASKEFPKQWLSEWHKGLAAGTLHRGDWVTLRSTYEPPVGGAAQADAAAGAGERLPVVAVGWADLKCKAIIGNIGTTLRCPTDSERVRHKKILQDGQFVTSRIVLGVKRPSMIELFFRHFGCIDQHDHRRQGSLAFERQWHTKQWWHRIFMTVLGVVVTNVFLVYRFMYKKRNHGSTTGMDDFSTTCGKLAFQLIHNMYLERERNARRAAGAGAGAGADGSDGEDGGPEMVHNAKPLSTLEMYQQRALAAEHGAEDGDEATRKRARRRCSMEGCSEKCSYYCTTCSDVAADKIVCFCFLTHGNKSRNCFGQHVKDMAL
jgi:hypothetical protein